jgi:hypothetical protein
MGWLVRSFFWYVIGIPPIHAVFFSQIIILGRMDNIWKGLDRLQDVVHVLPYVVQFHVGENYEGKNTSMVVPFEAFEFENDALL